MVATKYDSLAHSSYRLSGNNETEYVYRYRMSFRSQKTDRISIIHTSTIKKTVERPC